MGPGCHLQTWNQTAEGGSGRISTADSYTGPGISLTHPAHLYVSVIVLFLNRLPTPKAHCQEVWVRVDAGCCLESPTTLTWAQNHGTQSVPFTWGVWVPNSVAENSLRRIQVSPNVSQVWTETQRSCSYLDVRSTCFSIH